jgi:hypothetical protein
MDRRSHRDQPSATPPAEAEAEIAEIEDDDPPQPVRAHGFRTRLTASVPGAVAGVFLVCALAFGATLQSHVPPVAPAEGSGAGATVRGPVGASALADHESFDRDEPATGDHGAVDVGPGTDQTADAATPDETNAEPTPRVEPTPTPTHETEPTARPTGTEPTARPTEKPEPKPTARPTERPEPTPTPRPEPTPTDKPAPTEPPALGLTVTVGDGAIVVDWSACTIDGANSYKIVRSTDERVTWPVGDGDTLVAAIELGDPTVIRDEHAPAGAKVWYRVFCVHATADGYRVLTASPVRGVTTPGEAPAPTPDTCAISLEVGVDGGHAVLHWTACTSDQFSHYRILRTSGDVTTVVAEPDGPATTTWTDESVELGGTYHYQVQAKGLINGSYVLLGVTDVVAVTIG